MSQLTVLYFLSTTVLAVMTCIGYVAAYKGPLRDAHFKLCIDHVTNLYKARNKGKSETEA